MKFSEIENDYGTISFHGSSEWQEQGHPYLIIHPQCLSFLCRRINASPQQIWKSLYSPGSDYLTYKQGLTGLLTVIDYYDMAQFHDQWYRYCVLRSTPKKDGTEVMEQWYDPSSMKELQWLLARPTIFPTVPSFSSSSSIAFSTPTSTSQAPCMKVFNVPELFDLILDRVICWNVSQSEIAEELQSDTVFTPESLKQGAQAVFALLQVNKEFYTAIVRDHQDIFLHIAWAHGWMLPMTPEDWKHWPNEIFHTGTAFRVGSDADWRAYLLIFLRKEDVHVKNRWRFNKMALQFARGRSEVIDMREYRWRFNVGELGFRADVIPPRRLPWEKNVVGDGDGDGEDDGDKDGDDGEDGNEDGDEKDDGDEESEHNEE